MTLILTPYSVFATEGGAGVETTVSRAGATGEGGSQAPRSEYSCMSVCVLWW